MERDDLQKPGLDRPAPMGESLARWAGLQGMPSPRVTPRDRMGGAATMRLVRLTPIVPSRPWALFIAAAFALAACAAAGGGSTPSPSKPDATSAPIASQSLAPPPPTVASMRPPTPSTDLFPTGPTETAQVVRVVDGDTIVIDRGRGEEKLRYIGVDTPETVHPTKPIEWMGLEASNANKMLVEARQVVLELDVSETDKYGRLLRYVWVRDGDAWTFVNLELLRRGFAQVVTYPPDVKYVELYLEAQREAREAERGLWSADAPAPLATPDAETTPAVSSGCDPAYPTVCIPPAPPDLDCGDITFRRFEVLPPDPHRFDGNHDGVGCEV